MNNNLKNEGYKNLLAELRDIINNGKQHAYKAVDNIKVQTYWQIGERIVREELKYKNRADYGKYLINNLAIDLKVERGILYRMLRFYKAYPIVVALRPQLSWKHYIILITISSQEERRFYENKVITNSWSYRELKNQIKNKLYQNTDQKEINSLQRVTGPVITDLQKLFKPEYNLNFLDISDNHREKELEDKIVNNIVSFLKELGSDFSFLGHQIPILIDGKKHFIDLLLYNHGIPCAILVELKINNFSSRDIGQINKYVGYYRVNKQYAHEQDAIGLIICRGTGQEEVFYALNNLEDTIFISKYKTKLPSEEKIKEIIQKNFNCHITDETIELD